MVKKLLAIPVILGVAALLYFGGYSRRADGASALYVTPQDIAFACRPTFSKDGKKMVFLDIRGHRETESQVWVVDLRSKDRRVLVKDVGPQTELTCSPKTGELVYNAGGDLYKVGLNAHAKPRLFKQIGGRNVKLFSPRWSLNGEWIAAWYMDRARGKWGILVCSENGAIVKKVYELDSTDKFAILISAGLEWSPDGQALIFTRDLGERSRSPDGTITIDYLRSPRNLWIINVDGTSLRKLTTSKQGLNGYPYLVPGTKKLLFVKVAEGALIGSGGTIPMLDFKTGRVTEIMDSVGSSHFACSPDGKMLALARNFGLIVVKLELPEKAEEPEKDE